MTPLHRKFQLNNMELSGNAKLKFMIFLQTTQFVVMIEVQADN